MLGLACGGGWDVGGHGAVLPAVFAGRDAAFSLEYLREVALVAETCCHGDVMDAEVGVFEVSAGGVHPLLNDVSAGTDAYYPHEHALKIGNGHAVICRNLIERERLGEVVADVRKDGVELVFPNGACVVRFVTPVAAEGANDIPVAIIDWIK